MSWKIDHHRSPQNPIRCQMAIFASTFVSLIFGQAQLILCVLVHILMLDLPICLLTPCCSMVQYSHIAWFCSTIAVMNAIILLLLVSVLVYNYQSHVCLSLFSGRMCLFHGDNSAIFESFQPRQGDNNVESDLKEVLTC